LEAISCRFWVITGDSFSDDEFGERSCGSTIACQVRSASELFDEACRSPSLDLARSLDRLTSDKVKRISKKIHQRRYAARVSSSLSDTELSPARVRGDVSAGDHGSWFSALKLPVLESTSIPLGNIIDVNEWITVCRHHRHGGTTLASFLVKAAHR
jgi:hypothetical protein